MRRGDSSNLNELGIRFQGRVLGGELSVQVAQRLSDMSVYRFQNPEGLGQRAYDGLDPVLRAHLEQTAAKIPWPPSQPGPVELAPEAQPARTTSLPDSVAMPQSARAAHGLARETH